MLLTSLPHVLTLNRYSWVEYLPVIVIVNVKVAVLSAASFAVYTTVYVPMSKFPGEWLFVIDEIVPELSVGVGVVHDTDAYFSPGSLFWFISGIEDGVYLGISLSEI